MRRRNESRGGPTAFESTARARQCARVKFASNPMDFEADRALSKTIAASPSSSPIHHQSRDARADRRVRGAGPRLVGHWNHHGAIRAAVLRARGRRGSQQRRQQHVELTLGFGEASLRMTRAGWRIDRGGECKPIAGDHTGSPGRYPTYARACNRLVRVVDPDVIQRGSVTCARPCHVLSFVIRQYRDRRAAAETSRSIHRDVRAPPTRTRRRGAAPGE